METNELVLKFDPETTLSLIEGLGKSAYAIAVAHGFRGTEQEWLDSLKGLQGPQGEPGPKGEPFRYEDFTPEQLKALKGPKGDKGEDGRDGASATADNAHQLLLQGNVWCESASVDDVLTALIGNIGEPFPRTEFKPLTISSVTQGQQIVAVTGEPHYTVKVVGNDTPFTLDSTGACTITIPPLGEDDIKLTYHNLTGVKVSEHTIKGNRAEVLGEPDKQFELNKAVYKLYGRDLYIDISNIDDTQSSELVYFYGNLNLTDIDKIYISSSNTKYLYLDRTNFTEYYSSLVKNNDNQPIFIKTINTVKLLSLMDSSAYQIVPKIGTPLYGAFPVQLIQNKEIVFDESTHRYVCK
jgi:hypothetical protein